MKAKSAGSGLVRRAGLRRAKKNLLFGHLQGRRGGDAGIEGGGKSHEGRLLSHLSVRRGGGRAASWGDGAGSVQRLERGRMGLKVTGGEGCLAPEGIERLELGGMKRRVRISVQVDGGSNVDSPLRGWQGERRADTDAHAGSVQVARATMIECIRSARRGCIVARWLIGERGEGEGIGVQERRREPPWLVDASGSWIVILDLLMLLRYQVPAGQMTGKSAEALNCSSTPAIERR